MAIKRSQRGLDANQEQNYKNIIRDTRPLSRRIGDFLRTPKGAALTLVYSRCGNLF